MSIYDWERCTHEGIGQPGCPTCDPDKQRVSARYEQRLAALRAEVTSLRAALRLTLEALTAARNHFPSCGCFWCSPKVRAAREAARKALGEQ